MRIAILADPLDNQYAGIHIYTREFIRAVIRVDKKNEYILIRQKKKDDFPGLKQIIVPDLPLYTGFQVLRFFMIFPLIARKLKVDAVLEPAHFGPFNLPGKIKRITVIHDLTPILFPHLHRYHSQLLQRIFLKRILKKAALILSNSDNTSNDLYRHYPFTRGKVKRIYLGKEDHFRVNEDREITSKYNLDEKYFISVGTIEPRKNLTILLNAYQTFRNENRESYKLIIVGKKGWKSDAFFAALENHKYRNDIIILGYVSRNELAVLYTKATALLYPSLYEGFGLPVLEAMACGTPCILSNSSSLPEVGGDSALYFNVEKPNELAEKMTLLAGDNGLQDEMKQKSLDRAGRFSWEAYAREFINALETLK